MEAHFVRVLARLALRAAASLLLACPALAEPATTALERAIAAVETDPAEAEKLLRAHISTTKAGSSENLAARGWLAAALNRQRLWDSSADEYRALADACVSGPEIDASQCTIYRFNHAHALLGAGRFAQAIPVYQLVLKRYQTESPGDFAATLQARLEYARALGGVGRHEEAIASARQTLADAGADTGLRTEALTGLAETLFNAGRNEDALVAARDAVALGTSSLGANNVRTATATQILGDIHFELGDLVSAERAQRRVLDAFVDPEVTRVLSLGNARNSLAITLIDLGRPGEAEALFRALLADDIKLYGERNAQVATGYHNIAQTLFFQDRFAEAEALERKAYAIHLDVSGGAGAKFASSAQSMAVYMARKGNLAEAESYWMKALTANRAIYPANHPEIVRTLGFLARSQARSQGGTVGLDHARAARRAVEGRVSDAPVDLVDAAIRRAVNGATRRGARQNYVYNIVMETAALSNRGTGTADAALAAEAFEAAQAIGLSAAGEATAQMAARAAASSGPIGTLARRQQDLTQAIRDADGARTRALASADGAAIATSAAALQKLGRELAAVDDALRRDFPGYFDLITPRPMTIAEVQAQLKPEQALLAIVEETKDIHVFAITRDTMKWHHRTLGLDDAKAAIRRLRCSLDPVGCTVADLGDEPESAKEAEGFVRFDRPSAWALYRDLIEPVATTLNGKTTLYATATGSVADLPFALLLTDAAAAEGDLADPVRNRDAPYFGDRFALVMLPSVPTLRIAAIARPAAKGFVGYGDPALDGDPAAARGAPLRATFRAASSGVSIADPASLRRMPPLPGTRVELSAMARVYASGDDALVLGGKATEAQLRRDPRLSAAKVIAFATHGLLPEEVSGIGEPGLVFTPPATASADDDGVLAASEAALLDLSADWVILSACNTATAQGAGQTDSLSSLARAFLYAGAGALLASRWRIGDEVTAALTVETLTEREKPGVTRAIALQRAMRTIRTGRRPDGSALAGWKADWVHPAAWGPFALIAARDD